MSSNSSELFSAGAWSRWRGKTLEAWQDILARVLADLSSGLIWTYFGLGAPAVAPTESFQTSNPGGLEEYPGQGASGLGRAAVAPTENFQTSKPGGLADSPGQSASGLIWNYSGLIRDLVERLWLLQKACKPRILKAFSCRRRGGKV